MMMGRCLLLTVYIVTSVWVEGFVSQKCSYFPKSFLRDINKPTVVKPPTFVANMVSYEDLMEKLPSKSVIEAVESASSGKVVASDVAAAAGVSLSQARKDLTALASITRGDISVDEDGNLIYSFPRNLNVALSSNSAKYKAMELFRKAWPALFWGIRVSFGAALVVSIFAIFSTIFFIQSSSSSSDDDRDDRRGGGGGMNFGLGYLWGPSPFDFFYYRPYGYYGYYGSPAYEYRDPDEMGFLESVFSYVFGDGNVNAKLEETRLSLAANMIRENNGAVTAEQLAPFCDNPPDPSNYESSTYVDEGFVLPIVTALDGEPQVTEEGEIIYVFPELQTSASILPSLPAKKSVSEASLLRKAGLSPNASSREIYMLLSYNGIAPRRPIEREGLIEILSEAMGGDTEAEVEDPTVLQEKEWKFTLAPGINKFLAGGLGAVNLFGAVYLGGLLNKVAAVGAQLPSYFGLVQAGYPLLLAYAVLFNAIPLVRFLWIQRTNQAIRQRNQLRANWRKALEYAVDNSRLGSKLKMSEKMGKKMKKLGTSDVIFDTSKPIEDLQKEKEQDSLDDFDRRLGQFQ